MPPFTPCGTFDLARRVPIDPARWEVAYGPANVQGAQHAAVGGAPPQQVGRYEYHGWVGEEPAPGGAYGPGGNTPVNALIVQAQQAPLAPDPVHGPLYKLAFRVMMIEPPSAAEIATAGAWLTAAVAAAQAAGVIAAVGAAVGARTHQSEMNFDTTAWRYITAAPGPAAIAVAAKPTAGAAPPPAALTAYVPLAIGYAVAYVVDHCTAALAASGLTTMRMHGYAVGGDDDVFIPALVRGKEIPTGLATAAAAASPYHAAATYVSLSSTKVPSSTTPRTRLSCPAQDCRTTFPKQSALPLRSLRASATQLRWT